MNRAPLPAMTRFEFRESVWLNAAHAVVYSVFALPAGLGFYAKGKVLFGRKKLPQRQPQRSRALVGADQLAGTGKFLRSIEQDIYFKYHAY
jgi:hypothetical protein